MQRIPWWYTEIDEAERRSLLSTFEQKRFSQGAVTDEFERQLAEALEVPYVVVTTSGTAALTMALLALGVGPGDEVIVPALTWIATANAAAMLGARVVLVDCLPDLPLIDPQAVRRKLTARTKVVVPVHLNGRSCSLDELKAIAREAGVAIVEDACKALASRGPNGYLGTLGDLGCYSLGMISLISIGYGGVVVTRNARLYKKLLLIRNQGVPRTGKEWYFTLGFNFKSSDLLAGIGLAQLSRIHEKLQHIHGLYERYTEGLAPLRSLSIIPVKTASGEVPLCIEVRSTRRGAIMAYLERYGVETLKFHLPLHRAKYLANGGDFPNASRFAREGFILPCGPSQAPTNVGRCIQLVREWEASAPRRSRVALVDREAGV